MGAVNFRGIGSPLSLEKKERRIGILDVAPSRRNGCDMGASAGVEERGQGGSLVSGAGFFQDLAETIREALYVTEVPSGLMSYVNPAFVRLFGVTLETMNSEKQYWRRFSWCGHFQLSM